MRSNAHDDLRLADSTAQLCLLIRTALGERSHVAEGTKSLGRWRAGEHGGKVVGNDDRNVAIVGRHAAEFMWPRRSLLEACRRSFPIRPRAHRWIARGHPGV